MSDETINAAATLPPGEYAIVEVLGHRTLVGRLTEVERFGTKLCAIEPLFKGELLPAIFIGGASIYQLTPCTMEIAMARAPTEDWQLPVSVRVTLLPEALPAPASSTEEDDDCCDGVSF